MDKENVKSPFKGDGKLKKINISKKLLFKIAVAFLAVILAFGVYYVITNLTKESKNKGDVNIGGQKVTYEDRTKSYSDFKEYMKSNPAVKIPEGLTLEKHVDDLLILNAALKAKAKSCNVNVDLSKNKYLPKNAKNLKEFQVKNFENRYLKEELENCVIRNKRVFKVVYLYDVLNRNAIPNDMRAKKIEEIKSKLNKEFLPLFKAGKPAKEIAQKANNNKLADDYKLENEYKKNPDVDDIHALYIDYKGTSQLLNGGAPSWIGEYKHAKEYFDDNLKKKGDYFKEVVTLDNGEIGIYRLEENNGDYISWDEFLEKTKKDNNISFDYSVERKAYAADGPFDCSSTNGTDNHNIYFNLHIVDSNTGLPIQGASTTAYQSESGTVNCAVTVSRVSNSNGDVLLYGNCMVPGSDVSISATNYKYKSISMDWVKGSNGTTYAPQTVYLDPDIYYDEEVTKSNAKTSGDANTQVAVGGGGYSSNSRSNPKTAPVGSTVSFKHEINAHVSSNNKEGSASLNWNSQGNHSGLSNSGTKDLGSSFSGLAHRQVDSFFVSNSDVGQVICANVNGIITHKPKSKVLYGYKYYGNNQWISGDPSIRWDAETEQNVKVSSTESCVYVPYEFDLIPCIKAGTANCGGVDIPQEPGTTTPVTPNITGEGTPTPPGSRWVITRWKIPGNFEGNPETPKQRKDNNNSNTCSHYNGEFGGHAAECNSGQTSTGSFKGNPPTVIGTDGIIIPNNAEIGSRYCIGLSISPYKMSKDESQGVQNAKVGHEWRHSAPICVLVVKKPKMQIWSNGIYARGGIKTSRSDIGGKTFGSWVEFEALGGKPIIGFKTESSQNTNNLTFRNGINNGGRSASIVDKGSWGAWGTSNNVQGLINSIKSRYPSSNAAKNVRVEGNSGANANIGGLTGTGTNIYYGKDITITGNIVNSEPKANAGGQFAQTIIIADNIKISKDVTRVDAWLIASGEINTCPVGKTDVNEINCGKPLAVNGPVIARTLNSWRTAGSNPNNREEPAETYNQRADVYLWAYGQAGGPGRIITTYTKELPVRY